MISKQQSSCSKKSNQPTAYLNSDFLFDGTFEGIPPASIPLSYIMENRSKIAELEAREMQLGEENQMLKREIGKAGHTINNALSVFQGYTMLSKDSMDPEMHDDMQTGIQYMTRATRRLSTVGNNTIEDTDIEEIDLKRLIRYIESYTERYAEATGKSVSTTSSVPPDCMTQGSPSEIQSILENLAVNAVHALPKEGGEVSIEVVNEELSGTSFTGICIGDNGCGIPKVHFDRIFEPRFSTKGINGSGLGLSHVKEAVEAHNGIITVESEEGDTKFTVLLPNR